MTDSSQAVTVVNGQAWALRPQHIAQLLGTATAGAVIPDPAGLAASPDGLATVSDPGFWAGQPDALAEAPATSPDDASPIAEAPRDAGQPSAAAATTKAGRLTLTVEEAAALLGISRASAYEAVRGGEIPSIRIGRRVLVPRVALTRLVNGPVGSEPPPDES